MNINKTHIYCMPGLAASPTIFEYISLPVDEFEIHFLEWKIPQHGISLSDYAKDMCSKIKHRNPVLLGVSFGGLLVQEMSKLIDVKKIIIVSSIKTYHELPKKMLLARYTMIYKLLPTSLVNNVESLSKYAFGETITKRLELYERYLSIRDKYYIDWCIDNLLNWQQKIAPKNLVHIQGEKDTVFPISNIKECIHIKNGTHAMIIHRAKWFNENLPTIILD